MAQIRIERRVGPASPDRTDGKSVEEEEEDAVSTLPVSPLGTYDVYCGHYEYTYTIKSQNTRPAATTGHD